MIVEFDGEVFRWEARLDSDWYFVALPSALSDDIRETQIYRRGFGGESGLLWNLESGR